MAHLFLVALAVCGTAVAEYRLLHRIVDHPASTSPEPGELSVVFHWALLPLVACLVVALVAWWRQASSWRSTIPLLAACALGAFFAFVALRQYSHAAPGFLFLGFWAQVAAVLVAAAGFCRRAARNQR